MKISATNNGNKDDNASDRTNYFFDKGLAQSEKEEYHNAIDSFLQAIEFGRKSEKIIIVTLAYYNMGIIQWKLGKFNDAIESYDNAIKIGKQKKGLNIFARVFYNMGLAFNKLEMKQEAINSYLEAIRIGEFEHDRITVACAYFNMGIIQGKMKMFREAIDSIIYAYESRNHLPDKSNDILKHLTFVVCCMGIEMVRNDENDQANHYARLLEQIRRDANNENNIGIVDTMIEYIGSNLFNDEIDSFESFKRLLIDDDFK